MFIQGVELGISIYVDATKERPSKIILDMGEYEG